MPSINMLTCCDEDETWSTQMLVVATLPQTNEYKSQYVSFSEAKLDLT